jgi:hypothetical protein
VLASLYEVHGTVRALAKQRGLFANRKGWLSPCDERFGVRVPLPLKGGSLSR